MEKYTFRECTMTKLDDLFGLKQMDTSLALSNWLSMPYELTELERNLLLQLQIKFNKNHIHWNEYELVSHFIVPVFSFVNFTTDYFNDFGERSISAKINNIELSGKPDGIIATGFREPKIPFFCFTEYKPETDPYGEPYGQCLAAMLVGQELNVPKRPIYGCVVKGADWNFMILEDKNYVISKRYVADDDKLFDIFRILKCLKQLLLAQCQ
ncbi:MAG: hypothetical protein RLZZ292_1084 [Bacteroidota bacterium]|jgi:hypothetical protein